MKALAITTSVRNAFRSTIYSQAAVKHLSKQSES
jgi:hypothetical protein